MTNIVTSEFHDSDDPSELRLRIITLESQDSELQAKLQDLQDFIDTGRQALNLRCTDIIDDIRKVQSQIEFILSEIQKNEARESCTSTDRINLSDIDDLNLSGSSESDVKLEELENTDVSSSVTIKNKCKKLYQKIANKTHPDKTPDKDLHKIFIEAKAAYRALDYQNLEYLMTCVIERINSDSIEHLKKRVARLENLIRSKIRIINHIIEDEDVKVIRMFKTPVTGISDHAIYLYRRKLLLALENAKIELNSMIHKSGIYPNS